MTTAATNLTNRERELGAIINAYNEVTERLKQSHDTLRVEVSRLREQLEEKNRELARRERLAALGEMAAGVAHEIRNPLGGIQLYASLLIRDLADRPKAAELARKISVGVKTLEGIVGDILAFAGQAEPHVVLVLLEDVIESCLELAAPVATARQAIITVDDSIRDIAVHGDNKQLQRAVLNLLFNALEAMPEQGEVVLRGRLVEDGRIAELDICDDGAGIPADLLGRIFNPFFTTKDTGTGLGLAIVHRIAEANGGYVRAANNEVRGACFTLGIPAVNTNTTEKRD